MALAAAGEQKSEWAGIPLPIDGERLVVEPSYPFAAVLNPPEPPPPPELFGYRVVNSWWNRRYRAVIQVVERPDGKRVGHWAPAFHHIDYDLRTMGCSVAWGVEQESKALQLLAGMLRHHQFKAYLLTGMFLERSPRSGVMYIFRKLKPTVALAPWRPTGAGPDEGASILCCLCMHPIAHYEGSWAGAMCPTDDVIAHLTMMRGDEVMYWKRSTQHPPYRPEAGL